MPPVRPPSCVLSCADFFHGGYMARVRIGWLSAFLLLTLQASILAQQGTAQIGGKVTDEQGAILPGVSIIVTNEETGAVREVTSSVEGTYFVSQIVPGRYKIGRQADRLPDDGTQRPDPAGRQHADDQSGACGRRHRRERHGHRRSRPSSTRPARASAATSAPPSSASCRR